jgi:hypothetical protein
LLVLATFCSEFFEVSVVAAPAKTSNNKSAQKSNRKSLANQASKNPISSGNSKSVGLKRLTASGLYERAREYFEAGRYAEAIQYAAAAQRRTSASKLPTVLMSRSYYRMGKVARAAKLFLSVPLNELPRDAAIEYLLTMFAAGRYADVIKSFSVIPDNHPYRDVAKFYLGSSYLQLKQYQKASVALRSAKKIPVSLKTERRQLLAEIKDLRITESRGQFAQTPLYYSYGQGAYLPPPVDVYGAAPVLPGGVPGKSPVPKPAPPQQGIMFMLTPRLTINMKSTRDDYNGYNLTQKDEQTPTIALDLGMKYLGKPRSFGGQPSLDLVFTPSWAVPETKTTTSKLTADAENPSNVQNETTRIESKSDVFSQVFSLVGMIPVSEPIDVTAGFGQFEKTVRSASSSASSTTKYTGKISGDFESLDFSLEQAVSSSRTKGSSDKSGTATTTMSVSYSSEESTTSLVVAMNANSPSDEGIKGDTNLEASWARPFGDFSLELSAIKNDVTREPLTAENSVLSLLSFKGELGYSFGVGLSITLSGGVSQIAKMPILKDKTISEGPDEVFASGMAKQALILVKYAPISFASASVSYDYTDRALDVSDQNFKLKMLKANWSQKTITAINLGLNYSF